jgi:hypothetical protein
MPCCRRVRLERMANMTTIVGIFDNARDLDEAVERLAEAGIEDTVFDEAIVAEEAGNVGPALAMGIVKPDSPRKPDRHTIVQAFRAHLADYRLPDEVIEGYATTFFHKGKFVLVRTDPQRAEQVIQILRGCHASQVNRHG